MATKGESCPENQGWRNTSGVDPLTCAVCYNHYYRPKKLPCLHTFCQTCLESVVAFTGRQNSFRCPTCRARVRVPRGGVADLQTNRSIQKDLDMANPSMRCDVCYEKTEITKCMACYKRFCFHCKMMHNTDTSDQPLLFYCKPCSTNICLQCKSILGERHPICEDVERRSWIKPKPEGRLLWLCAMQVTPSKKSMVIINRKKTAEQDVRQRELDIRQRNESVVAWFCYMCSKAWKSIKDKVAGMLAPFQRYGKQLLGKHAEVREQQYKVIECVHTSYEDCIDLEHLIEEDEEDEEAETDGDA